jgi:hypothetical protein
MSLVKPDLWEDVLLGLQNKKIHEDLKDMLDGRHCQTRNQILLDILDSVQRRKKQCVDGWLGFHYKNKIVLLHSILEKAALWVEKFIQVGDVCMQYDPTHAAIPWAIVRFILQVTVNDLQMMASLAEGIATVSGLITRYAVYEILYLRHPSAVHAELETAIKKVYMEVLTYLLKARRYFGKSTARTFPLLTDLAEMMI